MENINKSPLMYGIIDSDGAAYIGENCVASSPQELFLELNGLNDSPDAGYKIVALGQVYLVAAAPQVVADERAAFEAYLDSKNNHGLTNRDTFDAGYLAFMWKGWSERAAFQAAPVQAQEPVAELFSEKLAREMREGTAVFVSAKAPVQPVAVPEGWKLVPVKATGAMADAGAFSGLPVGAAEPWIAKQVWEVMAAQSPVAPAAQGDAKDAETIANKIADELQMINADSDMRTMNRKELVSIICAAIAAKAAS